MNLRLVRVSNYLQWFDLDIRHKSNAQHIVSNALSRLASSNNKDTIKNNELNALFIVALVKMNDNFRIRILNEYKTNLNWQKISFVLDIENDVNLLFSRENDLIFRTKFIVDPYVYEARRLCISYSIMTNILKMAHDEGYDDFARCYEKVFASYYIRDLTRYLRNYLKHYSKCQIF